MAGAKDTKPTPKLQWFPDSRTPLKGTIRFVGFPQQGYIMSFGDGFRETARPNGVHQYTFPAPGPYTLSATPTGSPKPTVYLPIRVLATAKPNVTITAPDNQQTIRVDFNDEAMPVVSRMEVEWTPGHVEEYLAEPGGFVERGFAPGTHQISIKDPWSGARDLQQVQVQPIAYDPDFTLTEDTTDPDRMSVTLTVTKAGSGGAGKQFTVAWGDGTSSEIDATVGASAGRTYTRAGDYLVEMAYLDDPEQSRIGFVTVPYTDEAR